MTLEGGKSRSGKKAKAKENEEEERTTGTDVTVQTTPCDADTGGYESEEGDVEHADGVTIGRRMAQEEAGILLASPTPRAVEAAVRRTESRFRRIGWQLQERERCSLKMRELRIVQNHTLQKKRGARMEEPPRVRVELARRIWTQMHIISEENNRRKRKVTQQRQRRAAEGKERDAAQQDRQREREGGHKQQDKEEQEEQRSGDKNDTTKQQNGTQTERVQGGKTAKQVEEERARRQRERVAYREVLNKGVVATIEQQEMTQWEQEREKTHEQRAIEAMWRRMRTRWERRATATHEEPRRKKERQEDSKR